MSVQSIFYFRYYERSSRYIFKFESVPTSDFIDWLIIGSIDPARGTLQTLLERRANPIWFFGEREYIDHGRAPEPVVRPVQNKIKDFLHRTDLLVGWNQTLKFIELSTGRLRCAALCRIW